MTSRPSALCAKTRNFGGVLFTAFAMAACTTPSDPSDTGTSEGRDVPGADVPRADVPPLDVGPPPTPNSCVDVACAFPGAEGFGTGTVGGRGGPVLVVTTLAASGPGSLRAALNTAGPRIVVFAVSGVIDLDGETLALLNEHSNLTVLGQTSPGGITITGAETLLSTYHAGLHDVILRHLRFRGPSYDTISFAGVENLVIDHCDFSAGTDETFDVTSARNMTVQWSTIANSVHGGDSQNYGMLLAYRPTTNITLHHNLHAHHHGRCIADMHWAGDEPAPAGGANVDVRNSVVYDCERSDALYSGSEPETGVNWNFVGNYARLGPSSSPDDSYFANVRTGIFADDNIYEGVTYTGVRFHDYGEWDPQPEPFDFPAVTTTSATQALDDVLAFAGAWPRDPMNLRTVADVRSGTGALGQIDDAFSTAAPAPPADGDVDGIADGWEAAHGLSASDPADSATSDPTGYTYVEVYANELAQAMVGR